MLAIEKSLQDFNNEELFGSLTTDVNLTRGGNNNLDLGYCSDDDDKPKLRFTDSNNDDDTEPTAETPYN